MPRKRIDPSNPEITDAMEARIRSMTQEEAYAFLTYRTPGVPESDMTGMLQSATEPQKHRKERKSIPA